MRSKKVRNRQRITRGCLLGVLIALGAGCTEPQARTPVLLAVLTVHIDADSEVRERVLDVEATVESQRPGEGDWRSLVSRHKTPTSALDWPYTFQTDPIQPQDTKASKYQLTARARDARGAVLAQARVVTTYELARRDGLRVLFDRKCLDRTELCGSGMTCRSGACVDATYDPSETKPPTTTITGAVMEQPPAPSEGGLAKDGESCATAGEKRCAGFGSSQPLACVDGTWQAQPECGAAERCDTSNGPHRGTCQAMAKECAGQEPDVPFCDAATMRVCNADLLASSVRPCAENERCVVEAGEAKCLCQGGFVKEPNGCRESTDCKIENGGCDPVTECSLSGGKRVCSACPPGFSGKGETGCTPVLASLEIEGGKISPAFSPEIREYKVSVPLLVQRVTVTAATQADAQLKLNGSPISKGEAWSSPVLTLGANNVVLEVVTEFGANAYRLTLERAGEQTAYIKASNAGAADAFGTCMAVSGDTMVIGSPAEDSAGTGVNGDQTNMGASQSGAAYVFVRSGSSWKQQAYLKPPDTATEDYYGFSCAISGETLAIGAMRFSPDFSRLSTKSGSVYVYTRANGTWSLQQELAASDARAGDTFGLAVAVDGDTLVAGAPAQGTLGAKYGAAYVFTRSGATWTEQQRLASSQPRDLSNFGSVISLASDTLVISAHEDAGDAYRGGAVYVFTRASGRFGNPQRLAPQPPEDQAWYGFASSISGDRIAVGAPHVDAADRSNEPSGKVWVYQRMGDRWQQSSIVTAPLDQPGNSFGVGVSLRGDAMLVGASGENGSSHGVGGDLTQRDARGSGAAYLYALTGEGWKYSTYLKASNGRAGDSFGWMVALTPSFAVVTAQREDGTGQGIDPTSTEAGREESGAAYVFE